MRWRSTGSGCSGRTRARRGRRAGRAGTLDAARPATAGGKAGMVKHVVARREDIPPGGRKVVRVAGREVGIFNLEGTFYALKNVCAHQGSRVCLGRIVGTALPS